MIERFNFYDIYGYFIPGALLIGLLWLPHALVNRDLKSADLAAAVAAIILAYVAGHLLQIVAAKLLPHTQLHAGKRRSPSDLLLDESHPKAFASDFRVKLLAAVQKSFSLDASTAENRSAAFLLCRNYVIASKTASYVEQFEGMYTLMRGISAAAAIGCAYHVGWLLPLTGAYRSASVIFVVAGFLAALFAVKEQRSPAHRRAVASLILIGVAASGVLASGGAAPARGALTAAAAISFLAAVWAFSAYRAFTWTWAKAVYQHFYIVATAAPEDKRT
jgi:hypothetical protein